MEQEPSTKRTCSSCDRGEPDVAFYAVGSECRTCKRQRSKRNRQDTARKLAIAERLIDALIRPAGESAHTAPGQRGARTAKGGRAAAPAPTDPATNLLVNQE